MVYILRLRLHWSPICMRWFDFVKQLVWSWGLRLKRVKPRYWGRSQNYPINSRVLLVLALFREFRSTGESEREWEWQRQKKFFLIDQRNQAHEVNDWPTQPGLWGQRCDLIYCFDSCTRLVENIDFPSFFTFSRTGGQTGPFIKMREDKEKVDWIS